MNENIDNLKTCPHKFVYAWACPECKGWINVNDRLPDDFVDVLFFAIHAEGNKEIMTGHRKGSIWKHCCLFYSSMEMNKFVKVTHWMPLPEYPNDKI